MADRPKYSTIQQHQPLYAPRRWGEDEKRFVRTLQGILEDIYKRYGRLGLNDLSTVFRGTVEGLEGSVSDLESGLDSAQTNVTTLTQALALLNTTKLAKSEVLNAVFPVGSLYLSVNDTSPATLFGGTWEAMGGRFLLGADATYPAGSTGGEASHTLTTNEMPRHTHTTAVEYNAGTSSIEAWSLLIKQGSWETPSTTVTNGSANNQFVGGSQPHNNLPPYLAVYIWKRTA